MDNSEIRVCLEKELMYFHPKKYLKKFIKSIDDIYTNRAFLKQISLDNDLVGYIVHIVAEALRLGRRFKKKDCLKVLKYILRNRRKVDYLPKSVVDDLFYLYKELIFLSSEEMAWCLSTFIKDQVLDDVHIYWLICNYDMSAHIVNRLLRYPERNDLIKTWAKEVYIGKKFIGRESELISILIEDDFPKYVNKNDGDILIWAIYYSKCSLKTKEKLIMKYLDPVRFSSAVEVAKRLGSASIVKYILKSYK